MTSNERDELGGSPSQMLGGIGDHSKSVEDFGEWYGVLYYTRWIV